MELKKIIRKLRQQYVLTVYGKVPEGIISRVRRQLDSTGKAEPYSLYILEEEQFASIPFFTGNIFFVSRREPAQIPKGTFIQLHHDVADEIVRTVEGYLDEEVCMDAARKEIQKLLYRKNYLAPILDLLHQYTNNPVMFHDHNYKVEGYSPSTQLKDEVWNSMVLSGEYDPEPRGETVYEEYQRLKNSNAPVYDRPDGSEHLWIIYAAKFQKRIVGYLISPNYTKDFTESEKDLLAFAAASLAFRNMKDYTANIESDQLINLLLSENKKTVKEIYLLMNKQGLSIQGEYCILLGEKSEVTAAFERKLPILLRSEVDMYLYHYKRYQLFLLENHSTKKLEDYGREIREIAIQTGSVLSRSPVFCSIMELRSYYDKAQDALTLGKVYRPNEGFYEYGAYKLYAFMKECCKSLNVTEYYHDAVQILERHDKANESELGRTLYTYLQTERSLAQTGRKLNIHKNTVTYRIHQIRELTNLDFEDEKTCFHLLLSYRLKEIKGIV